MRLEEHPYYVEDAVLEKLAAQRQREYEVGEQLDRELGLDEPETGRGLMVAAEADLKARGILLDAATQEELLGALRRVSP